MHDVHTLMRFLLPPGRVTVRTVWMLGSHRRLVRRWECDTDLPKPGPFPQISQTAAICGTPRIRTWGSTTRRVTRQPDQDTGSLGYRQNALSPPTPQPPPLSQRLSARMARLAPTAAQAWEVSMSARRLDASVLRDWAHTA